MSSFVKRGIAKLLVFLLAFAGVNAIAGEAYAAPGGKVIARPALTIRSGPSTSHSVQGTIPYGAWVQIHCTSRGGWVTSVYGSTNLWDKVSYGGRTGFVSDTFIYTGTDDPVAPDCGSSAPNQGNKANRVGDYARSMVGQTGWNWWCEKWVEHVWGVTGVYPSAYAHYQAVRGRVSRNGTPPKGAVVFYGPAPVNGHYGHVMISLGDGSYVTTAPTIRIVNQSWPGAPYLGWYIPSWPGR